MAATVWSPLTRPERRQWLLTNGEVVSEPDLETSPSGMKVRVANTDLSAYSRDIDELLTKAAQAVARSKGTEIWMPLDNRQLNMTRVLGYDPDAEVASLHLVHGDREARYSKTVCWWRFKHPDLPVEAILSITLEQGYAYRQQVAPQTLMTRLAAQSTVPHSSHEPIVFAETSRAFSMFMGHLRDLDGRTKWQEFHRDNPVDWPDQTKMGEAVQFAAERPAVTALLRRVRTAEAMGELQIPDLRNPDEPGWLTLELFDSNVSASFVSDLAEYLDGAPTVEEAARLYEELQSTLRRIGVVMEDRSENDFSAALLAGNKDALTVALGHPAEKNQGVDFSHSLSMHLPTGTFIVNCSLHHTSPDEIAEKWEEAQMLAQLTGQEDTLLAYAKKYAEEAQAERTKKILKERRTEE